MDPAPHSLISVIAGSLAGLLTSFGTGIWWGGRMDARIANAEASLREIKDTVDKNHRQVINILTRRHAPPEEDDA